MYADVMQNAVPWFLSEKANELIGVQAVSLKPWMAKQSQEQAARCDMLSEGGATSMSLQLPNTNTMRGDTASKDFLSDFDTDEPTPSLAVTSSSRLPPQPTSSQSEDGDQHPRKPLANLPALPRPTRQFFSIPELSSSAAGEDFQGLPRDIRKKRQTPRAPKQGEPRLTELEASVTCKAPRRSPSVVRYYLSMYTSTY